MFLKEAAYGGLRMGNADFFQIAQLSRFTDPPPLPGNFHGMPVHYLTELSGVDGMYTNLSVELQNDAQSTH